MTRAYCGLYIDAGYLEHAAATRLTKSSYRDGVRVDHAQLIKGLVDQVRAHSGLPLLRVHWYDGGAGHGNTASDTQRRIGHLPHVKVRLGRRTTTGEQKGVDVRIGLDLATHARMSNVDLIYLVSGDDDLTEAVEEAQGHGAQVIVLAVPTSSGTPHGLAEHLGREADEIVLVTPELLDRCVHLARLTTTDQNAASADANPTPQKPTAPTPAPPRPSTTPSLGAPRPIPAPPIPMPRPTAAPAGAVYSSSTGGPTHVATALPGEPVDEAVIRAVCENVIRSWQSSSTAEAQRAVRAGEPSIPPDLDRALLIDLSDATNVYDLDFATRVRLRETFWSVLQDGA